MGLLELNFYIPGKSTVYKLFWAVNFLLQYNNNNKNAAKRKSSCRWVTDHDDNDDCVASHIFLNTSSEIHYYIVVVYVKVFFHFFFHNQTISSMKHLILNNDRLYLRICWIRKVYAILPYSPPVYCISIIMNKSFRKCNQTTTINRKCKFRTCLMFISIYLQMQILI